MPNAQEIVHSTIDNKLEASLLLLFIIHWIIVNLVHSCRDRIKNISVAKGIEKYKLVVTKQPQGCEYSIVNVVNNNAIMRYSASWVPTGNSMGNTMKVHDCLTTKLHI